MNRRGFFKMLGLVAAAPLAYKVAPKQEQQSQTVLIPHNHSAGYTAWADSTLTTSSTGALWVQYIDITYDEVNGRPVATVWSPA